MKKSNAFPENDENILFNQVFKLKLSDSVGVDWRTLGRWLKIKDNILEMIDHEYNKTSEKGYSMLSKWMQMNKEPTLRMLKKALQNMKRMDLIREIDIIANSSNPPDIAIEVNKDISEICTALKNYYLVHYGKINEVQPLLKAPANVDLNQKFVDLCIVDAVNVQKDAVFNDEFKGFLQKQMSYTSIPYDEIFLKEESVIFISGIAGIEKTWLLRKFLLDWSNNLVWKNVDLVFYLECRMLNQHHNISNINELLNIFYKDIINGYNFSSYATLFIIDGLDEFKYLNELISQNSRCNNPIVNALAEIQKFKHVISGRVNAVDQYQSIYTEQSDKLTIQIMGFNENGIRNYIENNVLEEKKQPVKTTLKEFPIAKAMASIPFFLSSMCKIISDSKMRTNCFLTMTDLFANIFLYFLQKHIIKNNKLIYEIMEDPIYKKRILNICKIAYELFVKNKVVFSKEEIRTYVSGSDWTNDSLFGFIEKVETNLGYYFQFSHLTIMEFCASVYAYNCLSIEDIMASKMLRSCLPMICGLANKDQNSLSKFLVNLNSSKESFSIFGNVFSKKRVIRCSGIISILERISYLTFNGEKSYLVKTVNKS
ncbi:NACHT, LRR and PYD domains-containing protein 1 homolog isoform X2 [Hydra vulgaris]|uniref:NACHT, LRR and PYD domains-containing protein 1 homolog isoform X2 n=1 Tax=Hydra vulgaris TaxID=6087 RepID=UPI001F5ED246|nr:NACHT, LRR and PYD domains-containing protein 1 homolog isoform X2 [Hydra vulgaris]